MVCVNWCGGSGSWGAQRYRIETAFSEGMAAGEATESQPGALDDAEADECYVGILRTGGEVEALRGAKGVEDG
jgi:hypothetical protein